MKGHSYILPVPAYMVVFSGKLDILLAVFGTLGLVSARFCCEISFPLALSAAEQTSLEYCQSSCNCVPGSKGKRGVIQASTRLMRAVPYLYICVGFIIIVTVKARRSELLTSGDAAPITKFYCDSNYMGTLSAFLPNTSLSCFMTNKEMNKSRGTRARILWQMRIK